MGGRNQEFGLAAAIEIDGIEGIVVLSGGTDGTDGPPDAAGAIVQGISSARERLWAGRKDYLQRNDSYPFLKTVGDLLSRTDTHQRHGPTLDPRPVKAIASSTFRLFSS